MSTAFQKGPDQQLSVPGGVRSRTIEAGAIRMRSKIVAAKRPVSVIHYPIWSGVARRTPNIYWIVPDSYPGHRVLAKHYGFDNRESLEQLRRSP